MTQKTIRNILIALLFTTVTFGAMGQNYSISANIGTDIYNYSGESTYINTGAALIFDIGNQMEADFEIDFALTTNEAEDGSVTADFFIPLDAGINFLFPYDPFKFLIGVGISPVFTYTSSISSPFRFVMGPYLKGGARVRVHPTMHWFLEVQQDLLIGLPNWINHGTRITTGVNFSFGGE
ncbi:MAG: hypothetical protein ACLFR1_14920 [Spirochaetia bacterium]